MTISFHPRHDRTAASSRLRCYAIAEEIARQGLAETNIRGHGDLYFYQKTDHLPCRPAIYDYDDVWPEVFLTHARRVVTTFTSDTEIHAQLCNHRCAILPDPIDYEPSAPLPAAEPTGLGWFGNYPCYASVRKLFERMFGIERWTISDRQVSSCAHAIPWTYATFPVSLRRCGTAFLSHAGMDPGKSNNKVTAAVTLGVPVIVGAGSPSYEALAHDCGLDWCVVSTPEQLRETWYRLQHVGERAAYLAKIQPYVWDRYRVEVVARRFMEIVKDA